MYETSQDNITAELLNREADRLRKLYDAASSRDLRDDLSVALFFLEAKLSKLEVWDDS